MINKIIPIVFCLALPATLLAQKTSGWNSLPEETIAAVRVDFSEDLFKKLQNNTKLGSVLLQQSKIDKLKQALSKYADSNSEFAEIMKPLQQAGIKVDDMFALVNSKIGIGAVSEKDSTYTVLLWADLKEKMMSKIYAQVEEKSGKGKKRTDIELDGQKVIYLTGGNDGAHVMVSRIGNRLIAAVCNMNSGSGSYDSSLESDEKDDPFGANSFKSDSLQITPLQDEFVEGESSAAENKETQANNARYEEIIKKHFARFIMAQKGDGGGFARAIMNKPGISQARPAGKVTIESYLDLESIIKTEAKSMSAVDRKLGGIEGLKALSMWYSFDGKSLNTSFFLSCPEPRTGLLAILEQPDIPVTPPNWVPANVNSYSHASFDFMKVFEVVKNAAAMRMGQPIVDQQVAMVDKNLSGLLGISLQELIGNFGKKMYMVDFGANDAAFVVGFNNPAFISKAFSMLSPFIAGQGIVRTKIQGFDGFIYKIQDMNISLFYGKNNLVFTTGKETLNTIVSLISNPPKGKDALVNSSKFQAFLAKENLGKSMGFSYADGSTMGTDLIQTFAAGNISKDMILKDITDKSEKDFVKELFTLMPTEAEMNSIFGFVHAEIKKLPSGFIITGKSELH